MLCSNPCIGFLWVRTALLWTAPEPPNSASSLDWMLLGYDKHTELQTYVKTLNAFYKEHPAFWRCV